MEGFCRGCGAPPSSVEPVIPKPTVHALSNDQDAAKPVVIVPPVFASDRLVAKNVWVAVLLAFFLGPPGLIYSTPFGALVMSVVSIPIWFFGGTLLVLAAWLVCIFWAFMAARD
jgi:hypothetical protein